MGDGLGDDGWFERQNMNTLKQSVPRRRAAAARWVWPAVLLVGLLAGSGCRSTPPFGHGEPGRSADVVRLRPGLMVSMSVLVAGKAEISEPAKRVSDGGTVVLPLLGEVQVADLTLDELQNHLSERYARFFIQPQVILDFVREAGAEGISPWGFVTVLGRVKTPGRVAIPATRDMTVSGAIQQAGGFATSARAAGILVTRSMPDGRTETRTINLHAVGAAGRLDEDIILEANDVVFVPEAMF
jgi:protein involved in polysaccharide export with SLBB domain